MILALALTLAGSVTVQLPRDVTVRGTSITLGSIASVSGPDAQWVETVKAFELGNIPAPGFNRVFQAAQIERDLRHAFAELDVRFEGEPAARVQPAVQLIAAESIRAEALKVLQERFRGQDAEIAPSGELRDLRAPLGLRTTVLEAARKQGDGKLGLTSVAVHVVVDGQRYQTIWTNWDVGLWQRRQVLARPIARGEVVDASAFEERRVKVDAHALDNALPSVALIGANASRDLAIGDVVTQRDVERPFVVHRGDTLHVAVKKGGITASATAIASQDGRVGDNIRVRTLSTNREISATVVARDLVQINLGPSSTK